MKKKPKLPRAPLPRKTGGAHRKPKRATNRNRDRAKDEACTIGQKFDKEYFDFSDYGTFMDYCMGEEDDYV